ncbi:MAG: head-tail connector protein [Rickettsiales bacterium]|nr:head-tail connector protein [Rickettsiales bacterium]
MSEYPTRGLHRVTDPSVEPLSVSEAKLFLRIDTSDDDSLIGDFITAARELAEAMTGRSLITQSWRVTYENAAPNPMPLPQGPILSITSVKTIDESASETTISSDDYELNASKTELLSDTGLCAHRIEVTYQAGYGPSASDVPADIRQAMLMHIAHIYGHRDEMNPPQTSLIIYQQYRGVRV